MLDPDFEMGAGEEEGSSKKFFGALQASFRFKNKGGGTAPPLDPPLF